MTSVFILLIAFQLKHFLCDFPLQGKYMLGKFSRDPLVWSPALTAHAAVHWFGTSLIVYMFTVRVDVAFLVGACDFAVHFVVDRIKASPNLLGRWKPDNKFFWWALGADQAAHHLTHYAIIAYLLGVL